MVPMRDRFFPRDSEFTAIMRGLDATGCVSVVGPGGVGKTRLVREFVERLGQPSWFVPLAARDTGIGEAVCAALNVGDRDALDQMMSHLEQPLLVLDNVEHVLEEAAQWIAQFLEAHSGVRVIVSSREALQIRGESVVHVGPFAPEIAVELFLERARERGARLTHDDVRPLVNRIGGLPLVLELAAGRSRTMAPAQILERMEDNGLALLADGGRDRDQRHRSVRALVDHSWQLLDDDARLALAECTAFRGDFDLPAAEAVLSAGRDAWRVLSDLVEKSLVEPSDDRFLLLEPIRLFAAEKLDAPQVSGAFRRHAEYYARLGGRDGIGRCPGHDLPNLLAAHHRVVQTDIDLAARLTRSAEYALRLRGAAAEMEALADAALQAHPSAQPETQAARGALLRSRAAARLGLHDHDGALADAREAVRIADALGDDRLLADALPVLSWLLTESADDDALATALRGVEIADRLAIAELQTFARIAAGLAYISRAQWIDARRLLEDGVDIAVAGDEIRAAGWLQILLGQAQERCSSLEAALQCYERGSACAEEVDDATWIAIAQLNIAAARQELGDIAGARVGFLRSLEASQSVGNRHAESQALMGLGRTQVALGENPRDSFHAAIEALVGLDVWYERGIAYSALGIWELNRHPAIAADVFRLAAEHVDRVGAHLWTGMMQAYRACACALHGADWRPHLRSAQEAWAQAPPSPIADDIVFAQRACERLEAGLEPVWDDAATKRATQLDTDPAARLHWLRDNHVRTWLSLRPTSDHVARPRLVLEDDGRLVTLPGGDTHDFGRRGPLRRMLLALARHASEAPGECLSVEDLLDATYPDEQMTFESGRMRIHTSIRRLRKEGLHDLLLTRDDGYLLDPDVDVQLS